MKIVNKVWFLSGPMMNPKEVFHHTIHSFLFVLLLLLGVGRTSAASLNHISWADDFSITTLNNRWRWIRQDPSHWSLSAKPGFLQIMTEETFDTITTTKNLLLQNAPIGDYSIETRLEFTPTQNWQLAGLLIYLDDYNWIQIGRAFCSSDQFSCANDGVYFDYYLNGHLVEPGGIKLVIVMPPQRDIYLRITRQGYQYTGYMSLDGTNWAKVGDHSVAFSPRWIGLKASNQTQGDTQIPANFDYFTLLDYSHYLYVPFIIK